MRTITIYSTSGQEGKTILTDATTWGGLKDVLTQKNIQHEKMKAVIGENRNTLEAANAELPATDFTLFLMPIKVKSGNDDVKAMSYKELRAAIKEAIEKGGEDANKHFNKDKNYTNKPTDEMRSLLASWLKKVGATIGKKEERPANPADNPPKTVADVVESVKDAKEESVKDAKEESVKGEPAAPIKEEPAVADEKQAILAKVAEVRKNLALMISDIDEFMLKHTATKQTVISLSNEKKDDLKKKAAVIASEFSDVQRY